MICTAARGGMRSVIEGYSADGLFSRWGVLLLNPHVEGVLSVRLLAAAREFFRFVGLLLRQQVSLVHCHAAMKGSFWRKSLFALLARAARVPVVFHIHGGAMKAFVARQPVLVQGLISWILARQSLVLVLSESWLDYVKSISPSANVATLANYVELPDLAAKPVHEAGDVIEVLFLGVVWAPKGVYDLLPAFKAAQAKVPSLRLIIAGTGEIERASSLAKDLQIEEQVTFAGWVSGDKKTELLRRAQICVLPSYNEGLPVCLLEAMSWQVPVISTRVGGIPDLVREGIDGRLVDPGDQDALSRAIIELSASRSLRDEMGIAARARIEQGFAKDVVLPKLEGFYRSFILANPTGRDA
ncbi:MAG: hypothetical protein H6R13_3585 [Proteobacteria bacterium]|nr:hypothetical protein [Pseudomonadota bacterium]